MRVSLAVTATALSLGLLAACETSAPYSNIIDTTGRGVGFSDYAQYMRAQEELSRIRRAEDARARRVDQTPVMMPPAAPMQTSSIGQEAVAAVRGNTMPPAQQPAAIAQPAPVQMASASPQPPVQPQQQMATAQPGSTGVSNQQFTPQPFGTPQQNRLVERDFVPPVQVSNSELGMGNGPNLFVYALSTTHNVGQARYPRQSPLRWRRWEAACAQYPSQDLAQEAFLAAGGPERDPNHLDPDGDGFACWWDPAPFRQAARTVRARE